MVDEQVNIEFKNLIDDNGDHPLFDDPVELEALHQFINVDLLDVCSDVSVKELQEMNQNLPEN